MTKSGKLKVKKRKKYQRRRNQIKRTQIKRRKLLKNLKANLRRKKTIPKQKKTMKKSL
jgi:hypothetical protein